MGKRYPFASPRPYAARMTDKRHVPYWTGEVAEDGTKVCTPYGVPECNRWRFFTSFESDDAAWVANGGDLPAGRYGCYYNDGDVSIVKWN